MHFIIGKTTNAYYSVDRSLCHLARIRVPSEGSENNYRGHNIGVN